MIAIVHSIYSQSVQALALNAGLMDNDAERYCSMFIDICFVGGGGGTIIHRSAPANKITDYILFIKNACTVRFAYSYYCASEFNHYQNSSI